MIAIRKFEKAIAIVRGSSGRQIITAAVLAVTVMFVADNQAQAQTTQYFQFPASIGYVAHGFDDTHAALPGSYHTGIDIVTNNGWQNSALAAAYGRVYLVQRNVGWADHNMGNTVIIQHIVPIDSRGRTMTVYTQYSHLASLASGLYVGMPVQAGTFLGIVGGTGYGTINWPIHLHFEVKSSGVLGNPSGSGQYWGYTTNDASGYGYYDPSAVIWNWTAKR